MEKVPEFPMEQILGYLDLIDQANIELASKFLYEKGREALISQLLEQLQRLSSSIVKLITSQVRPEARPDNILFLGALRSPRKRLRNTL
jgi:hypothetical protein